MNQCYNSIATICWSKNEYLLIKLKHKGQNVVILFKCKFGITTNMSTSTEDIIFKVSDILFLFSNTKRCVNIFFNFLRFEFTNELLSF